MSKIPKNLKEKWVSALRSGLYKQTTGVLSHNKCHCCLGVLIEQLGLSTQDKLNIYENVGITCLEKYLEKEEIKELVNRNDILKDDFSQIADYIEENL